MKKWKVGDKFRIDYEGATPQYRQWFPAKIYTVIGTDDVNNAWILADNSYYAYTRHLLPCKNEGILEIINNL